MSVNSQCWTSAASPWERHRRQAMRTRDHYSTSKSVARKWLKPEVDSEM